MKRQYDLKGMRKASVEWSQHQEYWINTEPSYKKLPEGMKAKIGVAVGRICQRIIQREQRKARRKAQ